MSYRRSKKYHYKEEKRQQIVFSTDPLSTAGPSAIDNQNEKALSSVLREAGRLKEHRLQAQQRELVLQALDEICQEWVKHSALKHNLPAEFASHSKVRLFAFGSYKLDVHSLGDDVDLLCVGPHFLTRDMFFDELGEILITNACVQSFRAVRSAYVPVMSFKYNNIDIDLVYSQLQIELLDHQWDINDDYNLRNLDTTSILSLNGVRLAERTLALVPDRETFRLALRAIRHWAKQRGIYSNKLGYLGGVSWGILTARVCQLYPKSNAAQIVQNFFLFYHIWNFGSPLKAITLCNIIQHEDMPSIKVWDPNDSAAKYELMHIITPAFPAMNSTHNVSMSTFEVLKREIARGFHLLSRADRIVDDKKWKLLFAKNTFFIDHKNYVFIKACAPKKHLTEWGGLIESKIRSLVGNLEHYADVKVTPYCKAIKLKLTKADIKANTHPDVLKQEAEIKRKKILKLKQIKAEQRRKRTEEKKLKELQLRLQKEREMERLQKEKEEQERKLKEAQQEKEKSLDAQSESTQSTQDNEEEEGKADQDTEITIKLEPTETTENQTEGTPQTDDININDGTIESTPPCTKNGSKSPSVTVTATNTDNKDNDDDIVMVSTLSLPIPQSQTKEKSQSKSPSINTPNSTTSSTKKAKSNTPNTPNTIIQQQQKPINPYIYVAPELQRRWSRRGYGRGRNYGYGRGRFNRYNQRVHTPNSQNGTTNGSSPAPSSNGDEKEDKERSKSLSVPASNHSLPRRPEQPAYVVDKHQIACCQSFNNKILQQKAEKYAYECKAFVIGLNVIKRVISVGLTDDGQTIEQRNYFDFTKSTFSFLRGLNHLYTDSHIIIDLISCNKVPHYLFPENENKRPSKEEIQQHQKESEENHALWKSKNCLASMDQQKREALTESNTPNQSTSASPKPTVTRSQSSSVSQTPKFDNDDTLLNDDLVDAIPGFNSAAAVSEEPANFEVNGQQTDASKEDTPNGKKRKREESQESEETEIQDPPLKKARLNNNGHVINGETKDTEMKPKIINVTISDINGAGNGVTNSHNVQNRNGSVEKEKSAEINYSNPYFDKINWDKKYDHSPTIEYAHKLYKQSSRGSSWMAVSHELTATASYVYNTCNDHVWKSKFKKVISNQKYGWNGCKYVVELNQKLMFDLAHDIAFNYIKHKNDKKRKRRF